MLSGIAAFAALPEASAQANEYHLPTNVGTAECPAGTSVIYQVNEAGRDEAPITIRYCTFPIVEGQGYVEVTTEAECGEVGGGGWVPEAGLCWGGGDFGDDLTAEICQNAVFVEGMVHPNPALGETNSCLVPWYKTAPATTVPTDDGVTSTEVDGNIATVELSEDFAADAAGDATVSTNPIVYSGPIPADRILRFTIPTGFENAVYTVRVTTTSGTQAFLNFTLDNAEPGTSVPATVAPPPPPELELALTDPYECGGGFSGYITDGTPPYTISYRIDSDFYSADLGHFVSDTGEFATPEGFLDYSQIPEAWYSVSISIADSAQWTRTLSLLGYATEYITDDCGQATEAVVVPAAQPADNEQPVGLAVTGTTTDTALLVSQLLLGFGLSTLALLRLAHVRRRTD